MVLLASAILAGCRSPQIADPATTWQNIRIDFLHGNLEVAGQKADEALRDYSVSNPDWAMKFRLLEAEILMFQGNRLEVIALLNKPGVSYPASGDAAIERDLLCGLAHAGLGQAQQGDVELQQARALSDASNSQLNGEVLRTQALVQIDRGHLTEAEDLSRQSLKIARARRDLFLEASDLTNLGYLASMQQHYDEAVALLNQAVDSARTIQARYITQISLENIGRFYYDLGDFEKALSSFQQAQQVGTQIGITSAQVDSLWGAGSAYYKLGDLKAATASYQEALKGALAIHSPAEIAGINMELAYLFYQERQFKAADMYSEEAIRAYRISGDKDAILDPLFVQALLAAQRTNGQDEERMLMQVHGQAKESPSVRWEIENALASFYACRKQPKQADLWYLKSIRTFEDQRAAVNDVELRLPFFANGDALYRDYADFLIASKKEKQALQLLDIGRAKTLAEALGQANEESHSKPEPAVDAESVARRLNATILFYSLGSEKSYLWAVTDQAVRLYPLPAKAEIEAKVQTYKKAILRSSDPLREGNETAETLYDTLVAPAAAMVPKGSRVFIIPDGVLNDLNFETLLTPGAGSPHYWIEDVTVSNANSIRMLSRLDSNSPPDSTRNLLLIGNPTAAGTGYDSLVNAFAEIRGVAKHFPANSTTVVTQSDAVPAAYAENKPDQFSYIHFVAHGTASRLDPLDSAVVLSPPPQNPDDFKLYARDIMRHPLHARLVTISACYGSGLRAYAGEGLVGLAWAFLRAGSHNVIGALWEINDAYTPLLMDRLYAELQAGRSPDAALRAAKLSLINTPGVYRKPLYWGGFQLYTGS
jgi:CHAT domain-containing protein